MKIALVTVGLFLLSYIAVHGGLGPNPAQIVLPLVVVAATTVGVRWVTNRGRRHVRRADAGAALQHLADEPPPCPPSFSPTPPSAARPRSKARKLF